MDCPEVQPHFSFGSSSRCPNHRKLFLCLSLPLKDQSAFGLVLHKFIASDRFVQLYKFCSTWSSIPIPRHLGKWPDRWRANPRAEAHLFFCFPHSVSMKEHTAPSSCARIVSSSAPSRTTAPGKSLMNFGFTTLLHFMSFSRSPIFTAA